MPPQPGDLPVLRDLIFSRMSYVDIFVEIKTGCLNTHVKFYIDNAIMHTVFIYGVFRTNILKPIFTINRITRNWAIEDTEYFHHLWSIWNYFPIFNEKNFIATPIVWVIA